MLPYLVTVEKLFLLLNLTELEGYSFENQMARRLRNHLAEFPNTRYAFPLYKTQE